jgi:hypothetical protein
METNEVVEINDLALTEDQHAGVKGGPTMQNCLVSSYQNGVLDGGGIPVNQSVSKIGSTFTVTFGGTF